MTTDLKRIVREAGRNHKPGISTLTTRRPHGFEPGDCVAITTLDRRWWRRLWYFVTLRKNPTRTVMRTITAVSQTTFEAR